MTNSTPLDGASSDMTETLQHLRQHGETRRIGSAQPILMIGDLAYLVMSGFVDVFSVAVDSLRPRGARTHLLRAEPGDVLFATEDDAGTARLLVAVGAPDTDVVFIPRSLLRACAQTTDGATEVVAIVERWVEMLCAAMAAVEASGSRRTDGPHLDLSIGSSHAFAGGMQARGRDRVLWVRHALGHSHLLGRDELVVNGAGLTPIGAAAWLEARAPGRLDVVDRDRLDEPDAVFDGLRRFQALALRFTELAVRDAATAEGERLRRRTLANQRALRSACATLISTLDPQVGGDSGYPQAHAICATTADTLEPAAIEDLLLAVAQRVGAAAGVVIRSYPRGDGLATPADPLAAIARASRVRMRQVALRGAWWTEENGPLIARLAAPSDDVLVPEVLRGPCPRPVALLPADGGYVLHDPLTSHDVRVDASIAATLHPFAHACYRGFPSHALRVMDVARFGFRGCGRDAMLVVGMGFAGALLGLAPAYAVNLLFSEVIPGAHRGQLFQLTLVLVACAIGIALFNSARAVALLRIEGRMGPAVQAAIWDRLLSLPMSFFRPYTAGDLAVRAMGIDGIRQILSGATVSALLGGVFSLVNFALMFMYSPTMAWRASLLILVAVAVTTVGSLLQLRHQRHAVDLQAKLSGVVLQLLVGVAKLRVAGAETRAFVRWATRFADQRQRQFRAERVGNVVAAIQAGFPLVASLVLFLTAVPLLEQVNTLTTGSFLAFLSAYGSAQGALLGTCAALLGTLSAIPLYEHARPILSTTPEVDDAKGDPGQLSGEIALDHVYFHYAADGPPTLRDLSLHVQPGEFIALVGPSGSGKSTILRLLLGFEQPNSGVVAFDGQSLAAVDVHAVRRQLGVVLQNGQLMSGDIFTNIAGSANVTIDQAWDAARMAGFDDDVRTMPMGMHTVISEGAATLSGGQRQRLMIARAIVQRPKILFFDEATSALDNRTQAIVTESLDRLRATRIVVAHRLSTIVNADRIVVIERGQVVQQGTYAELLAVEGPFAELARRQLT